MTEQSSAPTWGDGAVAARLAELGIDRPALSLIHISEPTRPY